MRRSTNAGRGIGREKFFDVMKNKFKLDLRVLPLGRPKKAIKDAK